MKRMTIIDVMGKGGLCVPPIQRDYVMGRPEEEVKQKLKKSLDLYFRAIFEGAHDPLYFVYGIRRDRDHRLLLLDGQQRLTTFILLVWFCDQDLKVVRQWTVEYAMRRSANYFMTHLFATQCKNHNEPWSNIRDSSWFLPEMEQDATVAGIHSVLDEIGQKYTEKAYPPIPSEAELIDCLDRVSFSLEGMENLHLDEKTFDQVFLKMNARGLPLTKWEIMKSILDKKTKEMDWKWHIDGDWAERIWEEFADGEAANLDIAMRKVVRMVIRRQTWQMQDNEYLPEWLCELGGIDHRFSTSNKINSANIVSFWNDCRNYFEHVSTKGFSRQWSYDRSLNSLWSKDEKDENSGDNGEFKIFIRNSSFNSCQLLRFDIICSKPFYRATRRVKRICLNLIDSLDGVDDAAAAKIHVMLMEYLERKDLFAFEGQLKSFASSDWKDQLLEQIHQEEIKEVFPEDEILEVEKDPLVYRAQIGFLLWGDVPPKRGDLASRLNCVNNRIKTDWVGFYCDLLARVPYVNDDPNHPCISLVRVPLKNLSVWGNSVFNIPELAKACVRLMNNVEASKPYPVWLAHLHELLNLDKSPKGSIKRDPYNEWMYLNPGEKNIVNESIRLDCSTTERKHRTTLLESDCVCRKDCRLDGEKKGVLEGRSRTDFPGVKISYNVNAPTWWNDDFADKEPPPTPGLPTSLPSLDKKLHGFMRGEVILLESSSFDDVASLALGIAESCARGMDSNGESNCPDNKTKHVVMISSLRIDFGQLAEEIGEDVKNIVFDCTEDLNEIVSRIRSEDNRIELLIIDDLSRFCINKGVQTNPSDKHVGLPSKDAAAITIVKEKVADELEIPVIILAQSGNQSRSLDSGSIQENVSNMPNCDKTSINMRLSFKQRDSSQTGLNPDEKNNARVLEITNRCGKCEEIIVDYIIKKNRFKDHLVEQSTQRPPSSSTAPSTRL